MRDKCSELQCGENIIFTLTGDHIMDGNVLAVNPKEHTVRVLHANGHQIEQDTIPYTKIIARYDSNGVPHKFGRALPIPSVLLEAR